MLTDPDGFVYVSSAGTPEGLYEVERQGENDYATIVYTDYATATRQYLCADPACAHNTDRCTSYIGGAGELIGLFCWDDHLYIYNKPKDASPTLTRADRNGADHTPFVTFTGDTAPKDGIAGGAGCWYYLNERVLEDSTRQTRLLRFDLADKSCRTLAEFPATSDGNYFLIGTAGGRLLIKRNSLSGEAGAQVYACDPARGEPETLLDCPEELICRAVDDTLVYWRAGTSEIRGPDLTSGADTVLYTGDILGEGSSLQVSGVFDHRLMALVRGETPVSRVDWDALPEETVRGLEDYLAENRAMIEEALGRTVEGRSLREVFCELDALSLQNGGYGMTLSDEKFLAVGLDGEARELTLRGGAEGSLPVTVLGESETRFCVCFDYEMVPVVVYDMDGLPYDSQVRRMKTAMIDKADYYAGQPAYTPVTWRE